MTKVAVCQLEGRVLDEAAANLEACRSLVSDAAGAGAELLVLPEGSYPAYVLGSAEAARAVLADGPDPTAAFAELARRHEVVLVAGIVLDRAEGLLNAAVTFGPDGEVLAMSAKRFLWHFDRAWFVAGETSPVAATPWGGVGSLVCADARLPEIARQLAVGGAGLVCDPTAWVTSTPGAPSNIQPDFLVAARCIENGVAMACASKAGFEGDTVAYAGRSMVVGPDGTVLAEAPERGDTVAVAEVDLGGLPAPPVPRRPEAYTALLEPSTARIPSRARVRLAAANHAPVARGTLAALERDDVDLVVTTEMRADPTWVPRDTRAGRLVRLGRADALAPEPARVAALAGAEVLAVVEPGVALPVLRARAAENRVFVVSAGEPACVVAPSGRVVADAPPESERRFVAAADCLLAQVAVKEMAPGTDVFAGRQPHTYGSLVTG